MEDFDKQEEALLNKEHHLMKKCRGLSHALIISGALNIGFFATFFILTFLKEDPKSLAKESAHVEIEKKASYYVSVGAVELLCDYFDYSYENLLYELSNKQLVEDGFAKRDFALACLISFHHFDIQRALTGTYLQTRELEFIHKEGGERMKLEVVAGLEDQHYDALREFAASEKWPLTPQGIYFQIQRSKDRKEVPTSLKEAFYLTPQFHCIWMLFNRTEQSLSYDELLQIAFDADWELLNGYYMHLASNQDFSEANRRRLLMDLLKKKSKFAAKYLIDHDREFALEKLDDASVVYLLSLMDRNTPKADAFFRELLVSARSDAVHKSAGCKLYELSGESAPSPYDHNKTLVRFLPAFTRKVDIHAKAHGAEHQKMLVSQKETYHTVRKGETLWQIAQDYNVSLQDLKKANGFDTTALIKPGMRVKIP